MTTREDTHNRDHPPVSTILPTFVVVPHLLMLPRRVTDALRLLRGKRCELHFLQEHG